MDLIPIAALEQQRNGNAIGKSIRGVVALIWPFGVSSKRAAILLAESDFRLRYQKGQVRIQFKGAAALALANSHVRTGDEIVFALRGAKWVDREAGTVNMPGKSVSFELQFSNVLNLEIIRDGVSHAVFDVNEPLSLSPSSSQLHTPLNSTPSQVRMTQTVEELETPLSVSAPKFHKQARKISGELVDSSFNPFEDDPDPFPRKKRSRTSWGSYTRFRMMGTTPSPEKSDDEIDAMVDAIMTSASLESQEGNEVRSEEHEEHEREGQLSSPHFGGASLDSQERLSTVDEFRIPAKAPSFAIFRDPPLFSRTTTSTAPHFLFTSSGVLETRETLPTVQSSQEDDFETAPSRQTQDSLLGRADASSHVVSGLQLFDLQKTPKQVNVQLEGKVGSPIFEPQNEQIVSFGEDVDTFQTAMSSQSTEITQTSTAAQRLEQHTLQPPAPPSDSDQGHTLGSEFLETYQRPSQEQFAENFQIEGESNLYEQLSGINSVPLQSQGAWGASLSLEGYVAVPLQAESQELADIPSISELSEFISYSNQDSLGLPAANDAKYSDFDFQQPTQIPISMQTVFYPQITGLSDREEIQETQSIEEQSQRTIGSPILQPVKEVFGSRFDQDEPAQTTSSANLDHAIRSSEEGMPQALITGTPRAMAIHDQPASGRPLTQHVIHETIEPKTPTTPRTVTLVFPPSQASPSLSQLLKRVTKSPVSGLRTSTSYYTPLANLTSTLNRSYQYDNLVDVLVIVTRDSTRPLRAGKGQQDYFTKFRVSQPGFWPNTTLISVFRPFKAALPSAKKGEVVLLRDFESGSLKRGLVGLISNSQSGWCVFKRAESEEEDGRRVREKSVGAEEIRGPPVEFGGEERAEVERLMEWWERV